MTTRTIDNSQDVLDSRDIIERIDELESELQDAANDQRDNEEDEDADLTAFVENQIAEDGEFSEDAKEYKILKALQDDAEGYSEDWQYGSTLIRDTYFTEYCQQLVEDVGDLPKELPAYIENNIDWGGVAKDLKVDYTEIDFDGVTYYVR